MNPDAGSAGDGTVAVRPSGTARWPVGPDEFKAVMSRWVTGVAVVTTRGPDGRRHGFTANSVTAVSLRPPLVLVCLDRDANCAPVFSLSPWIAIHVLRQGQEAVARGFARKDADKFAEVDVDPTSGVGGVPLLPGSLATLECVVTDRVDAGDHRILIAEVRRADGDHQAEPLIYYHRAFHRLG